MGDYLFDQAWMLEKRRLDALGDLLDEGTFAVLNRAGIGPGWRCLEVGAGSGTVARWMASRVGPDGTIVATDIDTRFLEPLRRDRIEVRQHDVATDPLEVRSFDLVHTRAVLQHVPHRDRALDQMLRSLRPGGRLVIEDIVMPPPVCHPELPMWGKLMRGMEMALRRSGADPSFGLALPGALSARGVRDMQCEARVGMMYSGTPSMEFVSLSVEQVGDRLVDAGILTGAELREAVAALRSPGHTTTTAIMIAAWGVAPE